MDRVLAIVLVALACSACSEEPARKNVLFISIDDLRPQGGLYGNDIARTPAIDELAANGVTFTRAYANVPVCGASRASVMTGLRPSRQRFTNSRSRADEDAPDVPTLAQHFRDNGYQTHSIGKVHHFGDDSAGSWTSPPWHPAMAGGMANTSYARNYLLPGNIAQDKDPQTKRPFPYEVADVGDEAYFDGQIRIRAIEVLRRYADSHEPFLGAR